MTSAQNKIEIDNKRYYNYYPQEERLIQLIIETTREEKILTIQNMLFHHTSANIWKLKIIQPLKEYPNTYLASKEDGTGACIIRLVNEAILGKELKAEDTIEAQISAFAINGEIYETEEAFEESVPLSKEGKKQILADGALMPLNLIVNNNPNLSEKEIEEKDHLNDNLLTFKGTIETVYAYDITMFGMDFPKYYIVIIETEYGKLPVLFTKKFLNPEMKRLGKGNIISGELFLSGDVCIYDYDKFKKDNDILIK